MGRRRHVLLVTVALTLAAPRVASAENVEALIVRGVELREKGKDEEALAVFREALEKAPSPRARAQVALAEQALGMWVAAEADLVAALAADADPWIAKNRQALEGALAVIRRHLGSLEVRGPAGARALLDGVPIGRLPAAVPFRVEAGTHRLEVQADGHHSVSRQVEIPPGGVARETVVLVAVPAEPETPPPDSAPAPLATAAPSGSDGHAQRFVGWVLAGTGAALLAAGGGAMLVREMNVAAYNDDRTCAVEGRPDPAHCASRVDAAQTWETVGISAFVGGGVLAIGGLTLVFTAPRRSAATASAGLPSSAITCAPTASWAGGGLACAGRF